MKKIFKGIILVIAFLAIITFIFKNQLQTLFFSPRPSNLQTGLKESETPKQDIEIIAQNLNIPWEIAFLPSGEMLVTERPGNLLKIGANRQTIKIEGVAHVGEGGLLGLALHPNFAKNGFLYLYLTSREGGQITNRVERYRLEGNQLFEKTLIVEGIKGSSVHDGGRIRFGPDGFLYITTGDAGQENSAQDKASLNGKILRVRDDGTGLEVYSYGHRNPQGLAWDEAGQLWATEHGPSGLQSGFDELNLILRGRNYGWPIIRGDQTRSGMTTPIIHSGSSDTWAPAGLAFIDGSLFFGGLRGEALYEAQVDNNNQVTLKEHFKGEFGRIRAVVLGPDGFLYISTSNLDGRGDVHTGDDKIIRINPEIFR
jgi:glucose/arabinose dehydrogenase